MFEIGGLEILIILLVALLVLGPEKLPGIAVRLAQAVKSLKAASTAFQRAIMTEVAFSELTKEEKNELKKQTGPPNDHSELNNRADNKPDNWPDNGAGHLASNLTDNAASKLAGKAALPTENNAHTVQTKVEESNGANQ